MDKPLTEMTKAELVAWIEANGGQPETNRKTDLLAQAEAMAAAAAGKDDDDEFEDEDEEEDDAEDDDEFDDEDEEEEEDEEPEFDDGCFSVKHPNHRETLVDADDADEAVETFYQHWGIRKSPRPPVVRAIRRETEAGPRVLDLRKPRRKGR